MVIKTEMTTPKILVISNGSFSSHLVAYALKMAQRLDFEIVTLSINEQASSRAEEKGKAISILHQTARKAATEFVAKGKEISVNVTSFIDMNNSRETAIRNVAMHEPGIRYVLSERHSKTPGDRLQNPLFNFIKL